MSEPFKIYIDRLKGGVNEKFDATLDPSFLEVEEPELYFPAPVRLQGEAYLTDDHLVIHLQANKGNCPERETLAPFIRSKERSENPTYFPFTDIEP